MTSDRGGSWALAGSTFRLDPARTALVIVDMQKGMAIEGHGIVAGAERAAPGSGAYYFDRVRTVVIPTLQRLLTFFRERRSRVVHVNYASLEPDGSDLLPIIRERNARRLATVGALSVYPIGHPEAEVVPELAPAPGERLLIKTTASAFTSTNLDQLLRAWGIEGVIVGGILTSGCVDITARDASDRAYRTVIVEDGVATWRERSQLATLEVFGSMFGRVAGSDELIAELSGRETAR